MTRCTDGVTLLYTFLHADGLVYILFKYRTYGLVLIKTELIERNVVSDALEYELSDYAMGITERYSVVYEVVSSICCVGEAVLC